MLGIDAHTYEVSVQIGTNDLRLLLGARTSTIDCNCVQARYLDDFEHELTSVGTNFTGIAR